MEHPIPLWVRLLVLLSSKILANDRTTIERLSVLSVEDKERRERDWREGVKTMTKTTKATSRSGRKGRSGETYNANHNTLEATRKNQPHIDQERMEDNIYIRFDRNCKPHRSMGGNGGFNATQHERERYEELFGEGLKARNERYEATRHTERCRTVSELYSDPKTAPMEILWQVGNSKCDLTTKEMRDALIQAFNETYKTLRREYGANMIPLDCGLHMDEKVPHIHFRVAMGAEDKYGNFVPNQNAALAAMGFERPDPSKPQSRYNSPLISFSDKVREIFYQACEKQGIQIDREVKSASRRQIEMLEYKCEQFRKEMEEARQQAEQYLLETQKAQKALEVYAGDIKSLEEKIADLEQVMAETQTKNDSILTDQQAQMEQNEKRLAEQLQALQDAASILQERQNELARMRLQLLKQAEAADNYLKSKTKHSFFQKDKNTVTVGLTAYQEAVGQVAAIKRLLDDPIYTPRERIEMQQATEAAERSKREYEQKSAGLDEIIEERVQQRISHLKRTEPARIENLKKQLSTAKNDLDYVCDAIEQCLKDYGINIQEFERRYKVRLGTESQDMNGFDDILPT